MKDDIDAEALAVMLAAGGEFSPFPSDRSELIGAWINKTVSVRAAYLRRARRLLKTWNTKNA